MSSGDGERAALHKIRPHAVNTKNSNEIFVLDCTVVLVSLPLLLGCRECCL